MKYKIGIITYKNDIEKYITSCSCGTVGLHETSNSTKCEKCGNQNFIRTGRNSRTLYPYLNVLEKNKKGFKVKRTNLSVIVDDEYNITFKPNMIQVLIYDLANHNIRLFKNGEEVNIYHPYYDNRNYQRFFANISDVEFIKMVQVDGTAQLFNMAWSDLSRGSVWSMGRKIYRGLPKLFDYTYLEILTNAGYPNVARFREKRGVYNQTINHDGKNPKEIFGLPKPLLKYIRQDESISLFQIRQLQQAVKKVDVGRLSILLDIVKDESTIGALCNCLDSLIEIHDTYGYNNIKKLTLYLFREIRMSQGIMSASNGTTLLRDYIRMSRKLGQEFEKYPKSLKKEHDITMMNYQVKKDEIKQKEFNEIVESNDYKSFEYKKKDYSIISPKEMNDLIKEGNELSHCVASYVESIITKRCQIYFLRSTESLDSPLATIEVRGGNVRQARGYANRALSKEEREYVSEWAKKKELELNYYY